MTNNQHDAKTENSHATSVQFTSESSTLDLEGKKWFALSLSTLLTVLFFLICQGAFWFYSDYKAQRWGYNLRYYNALSLEDNGSPIAYGEINPSIKDYLQDYKSNEPQKTRIIEQLTTISDRAKTHLRAAKDLYIWSTSILVTSTLASIITGLCLLHITRRGWDDASVRVIGIFVASSATLALGSSVPLLFKYEQNIKSNTQLYVNYVNLEDKVLTVLTAKKFIDSEIHNQTNNENSASPQSEQDEVTLDKIIISTHNSIQRLHSINYEINLQGVPSLEEITNQINVPQ